MSSGAEPEVKSADAYYLKQPEPFRSCLLALRQVILAYDTDISHGRMFQIPFFFYRGYRLAFLWVNRKKLLLGFTEDLRLQPQRKGLRRKNKYSVMEIDPLADLPLAAIHRELQSLMDLYNKTGETPTP